LKFDNIYIILKLHNKINQICSFQTTKTLSQVTPDTSPTNLIQVKTFSNHVFQENKFQDMVDTFQELNPKTFMVKHMEKLVSHHQLTVSQEELIKTQMWNLDQLWKVNILTTPKYNIYMKPQHRLLVLIEERIFTKE
jgi:hypothetical protein